VWRCHPCSSSCSSVCDCCVSGFNLIEMRSSSSFTLFICAPTHFVQPIRSMARIPPQGIGWAGVMRKLLNSICSEVHPGADIPVRAGLYSLKQSRFISESGNVVRQNLDATQHAELCALSEGCRTLGNERLLGHVLVCSLEPCLMCVGAAIHARVDGIVFGAFNDKTGAVCSQLKLDELSFLNHRPWWVGGVLVDECSAPITTFFAERRKQASLSDQPQTDRCRSA
jgi:tRNA(adenine34) deaminase